MTSDKNLRSRILAATLLVPIAVVATWYGGRWFSALVTFGGVLMVFEWSRLFERTAFSLSFYALTLTAIIALGLAAYGKYEWVGWAIGAGGVSSAVLEYVMRQRVQWAVMGALYIILPCAILIWIREAHEHGRFITFFLFASVWMTDIGAYAVGRNVGGKLLVPTLSPNKTWSGAIGGVVIGALAAVLVTFGFDKSIPPVAALFIGILIGIVTVLGDIFESAIKRRFEVKDASGLIPGHGGLLDRVDGLIFAIFLMGLFMLFHDMRTAAI